MNEHDLMQIREAVAEPTVAKAISATEQVLASLGYIRLESNIPGKKANLKLKTRVFDLSAERYGNLSELAKAMELSLSEVYRVNRGTRNINQKFIIGALKAFPEHRLDDLFYAVPNEGVSPHRSGISVKRMRQIVKATPEKPDLSSKVMLTPGEVARFLNVHINTVRRWSKTGILKSYRISPRGDRRFRREDVDDLLRKLVPSQGISITPGGE